MFPMHKHILIALLTAGVMSAPVIASTMSLVVTQRNGQPLPGGPATSVEAEPGDTLTVDILASAWGPAALRAVQAQVDPASLAGAGDAALAVGSVAIDDGRADYAFAGFSTVPANEQAFATTDASGAAPRVATGLFAAGDSVTDPGTEAYVGSLDLQVPLEAAGLYTVSFDGAASWLLDDASPPSAIGPLVLETVAINVIVPCVTFADCADDNADGIRDDGCVFWACKSGACVSTDIVYADMGGPNGACGVDGAPDGNDRFHALNCFSNQTTLGVTGYPCETDPPAAFNVDAAGLGMPCVPDGVCDGNDTFAALNAFEGSTTCSCPLDGNPIPQAPAAQVVVDSTAIRLILSTKLPRPGELVEVDIIMDSAVSDLRGYQIHMGAVGGHRGSLRLVDIEIQDRKDWVYSGLGAWTAFNVRTGQMLAGLDTPNIEVPKGAYLATYIYKVSDEANGEFAVELLTDEADRTHRTFLFPTQANGKIDIEPGTRSRVLVDPQQPKARR